MKKIRITKKILLFSFLLFIFSTKAISSNDYYFEKSDPVDDVFEIDNETEFSSKHSFIDLIYGQVFDYGNRLDFTIKTKNDIRNIDGVSYGFIITSEEGKDYKIVYSEGIATFDSYLNCENESYNETIIITISKDVFSHISIPWNVSVYGKFYGNYKDILYLDPIIFESDEDDDKQEEDIDNENEGNDTPGFDTIIMLLSILLFTLMVIIYLKHKK